MDEKLDNENNVLWKPWNQFYFIPKIRLCSLYCIHTV